jgi:hypothetical protein
MPNDAKLGMAVGLGLVIVVAVFFFRKDPAADAASVPRAVEPPASRTHGTPAPPRPLKQASLHPAVAEGEPLDDGGHQARRSPLSTLATPKHR